MTPTIDKTTNHKMREPKVSAAMIFSPFSPLHPKARALILLAGPVVSFAVGRRCPPIATSGPTRAAGIDRRERADHGVDEFGIVDVGVDPLNLAAAGLAHRPLKGFE